MRTFLPIAASFLVIASTTWGQVKLQEDFETSDSTHLPLGWTSWNEAGFLPLDSLALWTVQDTGLVVPGIADPRRSVAHSPTKAIHASWWAGVDTNGVNHVADDWLVTPRIYNIAIDDSLRFWAIGGNGGTTGTYFVDTLEVWLGDQDSLPSSQQFQLALITWRNGTSVYGVFQKYTFSLRDAAGFNVFISFRYHTDVTVDGFVVFLDDVQVAGPLTDVGPSRGLPAEVSLAQNYPNPFNPSTTIEWTVPTASKVSLKIFNLLGEEVGTLVDADMSPGEYRTTWNASGFPTGMYFYRLQVGGAVQTRKLILAK